MMRKTHKVIAASTAFVLQLSFPYVVGAWLFATLPDIDYKFGHRKFTHSLICLSIFSLLFWTIWKSLGICFIIGYGTHIIADSFTKMGVPLLYPMKKMYGLRIIRTGSEYDWLIFYLCMAYLLTKIR